MWIGEEFATGGKGSAQPRCSYFFVRGVSAPMRALESTLEDIAITDVPVLLAGESGTGKEVLALEIHRLSRHRDEAFLKCGCAGLTPESLATRLTRVNEGGGNGIPHGGSLFLDEITHLEPSSQARLLNLLPKGGRLSPETGLNVRVISSTTRNLEDEIRKGRFQEQLFHRINGVCLRLPPLRDRKDDIPGLLDFFLKKYASLFERAEPQPTPRAMDLILRHSWPGNIRELENVARKIVTLGDEHMAMADIAEKGARTSNQL
jgi:two-component system, NtrC family, response regulator AtoC